MRKGTSRQYTKPVPQRTCLACRQTKAKRELVRLVRTPDGDVEVDTSGRKRGRGAYLCPTRECWGQGLKGNRLERALRVQLSQNSRERLAAFGEAFSIRSEKGF